MPPAVRVMQPGRWTLVGAEPLRKALAMLPVTLTEDGAELVMEYPEGADERFAGKLAQALRELGFAFAATMDWSPATYVLALRKQGVFVGPFKEIKPSPYGGWEVNQL